MNKLPGIIQSINRSEAIMLLDLEVFNHPMSALLTENPFSTDWIKERNSVSVAFKETEVSLMKDFTGKLSIRNQLPCIVTAIEKGPIIGCVHLLFNNHHLTSAITSRSIESMGIKPGDEVTAMIKANEVSVMR